ncbi:hypothetical protein [Streptococcus parapneumoniae]|uniref:hypothetical protein n=1 Tax=Streptococcus parapneumoniae TaxID=2993430 RepID=UPI0030D49D8B
MLSLTLQKAVTNNGSVYFFQKSFWPTFLTVQQTVILLHLKDGLDRQYLTTESIYWVIGTFIFVNILVAVFSNMKIGDKEK